ncbi:uncharacterized protein LOC124798901 [Schistocerca piceifrons]|uniref:uncharacterized protein LOC124798901 n=1 Tax=Schistocerca piceifrons TaxID=274613 RepID=UPI001F5F75F5|nr:uncharacterized protein LOC124798901 [Schistocerca piceifrons]
MFSLLFHILMRKYGIKNHTLFHVYYGNFMATKYRKNVVDRLTILLGFSGGLLSLFTGFSFMAGFEVIYIFTLQLMYVGHPPDTKDNRTAPFQCRRNLNKK